jgi:cellulose synthase/poly-beta-1,6-N-acetylglucosamine synthase-like glycosyltransferase
MLINILFWTLIFIIIHTYILYPIIIFIFARFAKANINIPVSSYSVSIIISAYNEEKVIRERILNISRLNYDFNNVEVLIGSDCSTDNTNRILTEMKETFPWLSIYLFDARRGKVSVINDLVLKVKTDIIVFTDANTVFDKNSLTLLLRQFSDKNTGGICGRLILQDPSTQKNESVEEKRYWEYETFIKKFEGECGILIGANGGIFAIRKNLFKQLPTKKPITDDIFISLMILQQNYKFSYEYEAFAVEEVGHEIIHEFKRKTRFAATNFETMSYFKDLIFNKNIMLSYAFWSHKILRWLTPVFLLLIFVLNIYLINGAIFQISLIVQLFFYMLSLIGFLLRKSNFKIKIFTLPFYFSMTNFAMFIGMINFILKRQTAYWQSTPR